MDREGAPRPADPSDLALASSHEDFARGDDRDLCLGREGAATGVLQPKLQEFSLRNLEGEGRRKVNPRSRRHGGVEHELSGGALSVNSRRDNAHRRDPLAPTAAASIALNVSSCRALKVGVQGQRKPWR